MKRRAEYEQAFEAIKDNLYAAGVSTVKAAKAHDEMFTTSLEALAEAYEAMASPQLSAGDDDHETTDDRATLSALITPLRQAKQQALAAADYDAYVAAETKLQQLDELVVLRLERQVRQLLAQQRLQELTSSQPPTAPAGASASNQPSATKPAPKWTEKTLKTQYKSLDVVKAAFGIKARSWKEAAAQLNASGENA